MVLDKTIIKANIYAGLKKKGLNIITKENVFKVVVFCMKFVKGIKADGKIKKELVVEVIMVLIKANNLENVIEQSIIELTIDQTYEVFESNFKGKCFKCF